MNDQLPICPWCGKDIFPYESSVIVDGDRMHTSCAAEEEDDAMFDRDMGFGSD